MQSVKFHLKDVNPFNTILVKAWDSRKINHFKYNECVECPSLEKPSRAQR